MSARKHSNFTIHGDKLRRAVEAQIFYIYIFFFLRVCDLAATLVRSELTTAEMLYNTFIFFLNTSLHRRLDNASGSTEEAFTSPTCVVRNLLAMSLQVNRVTSGQGQILV